MAAAAAAAAVMGGAYGSKTTPICGPLLRLLASMISTLASGPLREDSALLSPLMDVIRYLYMCMYMYMLPLRFEIGSSLIVCVCMYATYILSHE